MVNFCSGIKLPGTGSDEITLMAKLLYRHRDLEQTSHNRLVTEYLD